MILLQGVQGEAGDRDLLFSDEDDDFSSAEEGSDSEPLPEEAQQQQQPHQGSQQQTQQQQQRRRGKTGRSATGGGASAGASSATSAAAVRQRNLKQKFVALLKKFKVTDPEELEQEQVSLDQKLSGESFVLSITNLHPNNCPLHVVLGISCLFRA